MDTTSISLVGQSVLGPSNYNRMRRISSYLVLVVQHLGTTIILHSLYLIQALNKKVRPSGRPCFACIVASRFSRIREEGTPPKCKSHTRLTKPSAARAKRTPSPSPGHIYFQRPAQGLWPDLGCGFIIWQFGTFTRQCELQPSNTHSGTLWKNSTAHPSKLRRRHVDMAYLAGAASSTREECQLKPPGKKRIENSCSGTLPNQWRPNRLPT